MKKITKASVLFLLLLTVTLLSSCGIWEKITTVDTEAPRSETEAPGTEPVPETKPDTEPVTDEETEPETEPMTDPTADDFVIEDGVLLEYRGEGGVVALPDEVKEIPDGVFAASGTAGSILTIRLGRGVETIGEKAFEGLYLMNRVDVGSNPNFFFENGILGRNDSRQFFWLDTGVFDRLCSGTIRDHYKGKVGEIFPSAIVFRSGVVRGEFIMSEFCAESVSAFGLDIELSEITPVNYNAVIFDFDDWTDSGFVFSNLYTNGRAGDTYIFTEDGFYEFHNGGNAKADDFLERVPSFGRGRSGSLTYQRTARRYLWGEDINFYTGNEDFYFDTGRVSFEDGALVFGEPETTEPAGPLFLVQDETLRQSEKEHREAYFEYLVTSGEYLWDFEYGDFRMNTTTLFGYFGEGGEVVIPDFVTKIADSAFSYADCHKITKLTLGEKTEHIAAGAFSGLTGPTVFVGNEFYEAHGTLLHNEDLTFLFLAGGFGDDSAEAVAAINGLFDEKTLRLPVTTAFTTLTIASDGTEAWIDTLTAGKKRHTLNGEKAFVNEDLRCLPVSGLIYLESGDAVRLITGTGVKLFRNDDETDRFNFMDLVYDFTLTKEGKLRYTASRRYLSLLSDPAAFFCYANDADLPLTVTGEVTADGDGLLFIAEETGMPDPEAWRAAYEENFGAVWEALGEDAPDDTSLEYLLAHNSEAYAAVIGRAGGSGIEN